MSLYLPAMLTVVMCEVCVASMCMTRKRRRCPADREELDLILIVQPTAKVLSQKRAT